MIKCLKRSLRWQPARLRCSGSSSVSPRPPEGGGPGNADVDSDGRVEGGDQGGQGAEGGKGGAQDEDDVQDEVGGPPQAAGAISADQHSEEDVSVVT